MDEQNRFRNPTGPVSGSRRALWGGNWTDYLQIRQEFMLEIMKAVSELGLDFAFPTQTLHLEGHDTRPPGAPSAMRRQSPP